MDTIVSENKPNLRNESVAFRTVSYAGAGAVLGMAVAALTAAIPSLRREAAQTFTQAFRNRAAYHAIDLAIFTGAIGYTTSRSANAVKDNVRPYIEKLEDDRNRLTDIALNGAQRT